MQFVPVIVPLALAVSLSLPAVPALAEDEPLNRLRPDAQTPAAAANLAVRPAPMTLFNPFAWLARAGFAGAADVGDGHPDVAAGANVGAGGGAAAAPRAARISDPALDAAIARHAAMNGVPVALVHRVVMRESRYNPRAVGKDGAMGLMQIKPATARGVGYRGPAAGLLDAETNLIYAVKYLAGAYRAAGGNHDRAVALYARGYYREAKRLRQSKSPTPAPRRVASGDAAARP